MTISKAHRDAFRGGALAIACGVLLVLAGCDRLTSARLECIAPAAPAGGWDLICRTLSTAFRELEITPGTMRVRNVPGAGGAVAFSNVVSQQPANENLIVAASPSTTLGLAQGLYGDFTTDDVRWLAAVGAEAGVIAVRKEAPWQTLEEFVEDWRQNPGSIAIGGGSAIAGQDHMKSLIFARAVGVPVDSVRYVPFDGGGEAATALLGGFIQMFPGDGSELRGQIEAGTIRILAVLGEARQRGMLANIPTAGELGYDVEWIVWKGFFAPPDISDEAYELWVSRLQTLQSSDEWPTMLGRIGLEPYFVLGPDFEEMVRLQVEDFRKLSREMRLVP